MSMTESIRQRHTLSNSISNDILRPLDNVFIDIKLKQINQQSPNIYNNRYGNNNNNKMNSENE